MQIELGNERSKEKHPGAVGFEPLPLEAFDCHWCGDFGDLRPCYGPADFELGSPRKFFESFFRQDTLDGAHGNVYRLLVEQLGDIAGGEFALPPFNNFLSLISCIGND